MYASRRIPGPSPAEAKIGGSTSQFARAAAAEGRFPALAATFTAATRLEAEFLADGALTTIARRWVEHRETRSTGTAFGPGMTL